MSINESTTTVSACQPRRVYIDLGVNWCNTIHQYRRYEPDGANRSAYTGWEVYGFEASPLIQPYIENHMAWLDGRRAEMPILCLPPTGSSGHLAKWAPHYSCPAFPNEPMRECVFQKLAPHLAALRPDARLNRSGLVEARLRSAKLRGCSNSGSGRVGQELASQRSSVHRARTRFTFIPAAAAASSTGGWMWIWSPAEQTIRGGGHPFETKRGGGSSWKPTAAAMAANASGWFRVRAVDVGSWLLSSFDPRDHVVLKMDIEGAEHALIHEMLQGSAAGAFRLVDVFYLECHIARKGDECLRLKHRVRLANPSMRLLSEPHSYQESSIDAEAHVLSSSEMTKRLEICAAAVKVGYSLFQAAETPHTAEADLEVDNEE